MPPKEELDELEAQLDPTALHIVRLLRTALAERDEQVAKLTQQVERLQRMLFGRRSEKMPSMGDEVRRLVTADELTVDGEPMPEEPEKRKREKRRTARKKSEPKRQKKRAARKLLPMFEKDVDVTPEQLPEGYALADFRQVGDRLVIERVEHVREHLIIRRYRLQTLASFDGQKIVKAVAPPTVAEGSHYDPGVYAHVITSRCDDSMPLYRIEKAMGRAGCSIARSTLCALFHRGAETLKPLYQALLAHARQSYYLHADETTQRVQAKDQCKRGWVWTLLSPKAIVYHYSDGRDGETAKQLLEGTQGYLTIDGYSGYNCVVGEAQRLRVACWSHARRKFYEARNSAPEAQEVLDLIVELYLVEHEAQSRGLAGTKKHLKLRNKRSRRIAKQIADWVDERAGDYSPSSNMGKALTYAKNQREALERFLEDANLSLDNNVAERALRILALGRKNSLFSGHAEGAQNLAILHSIVSTCRLHSVNPYEYVKDMLMRVQRHPASQIDDLLPWNWRPLDPGNAESG